MDTLTKKKLTVMLDAGYKAMSLDVCREADAQEWIQSDVEVSDIENSIFFIE